jgi:dihydroorotate dehydrogenase
VAQIRQRCDLPIVGTGDAARAEDMVEMALVGATAVGVHTAPLLRGLDGSARRWTGWSAGSTSAAMPA